MLIITIPAIILIFLVEGLPMLRSKLWKELTTLGFLLGIALFLTVGSMLGIQSPFKLLGDLLSSFGKAIFQ